MPNFNNKENRFVGPPEVVEKCAPVFVNCKGTLGSVSTKATPKNIGRLEGPPIKQINCGTSINDIRDFVKGDPGSLFTFICPEGCAAGGGLVGSALYSYKSSICKAGIQQGILSNSESNYVSIVIGYPQNELTGAINSENIKGDKWPNGQDSGPIETFAVVPASTCALYGQVGNN